MLAAPDLPLRGRHRLGAALRLCLVTGRQRQDRCSRRLRSLLRRFPGRAGRHLHDQPADVVPAHSVRSSLGRSDNSGASPWLIGQNSANPIRSGFASGASFASLSTANPLLHAAGLRQHGGPVPRSAIPGVEPANRAAAGQQELGQLGLHRQPRYPRTGYELSQLPPGGLRRDSSPTPPTARNFAPCSRSTRVRFPTTTSSRRAISAA